MKFQFGDSTESPFEFDYLTFLEKAVESFVVTLHAHADVCDAERERDEHRIQAAHDTDSINKVALFVKETLESISGGAAGSCAGAIARAAENTVEAELSRSKKALQRDLAAAGSRIDAAISRGLEGMERLLTAHDLPRAVIERAFALRNDRYCARVAGKTPYGVNYLLDVNLPSDGPLKAPMTVASVARKVVVQLPHARRRQTLDKLIVTAAVFTASSARISLREPNALASDGFDILLQRGDNRSVQLRSVVNQTTSQIEIDVAARNQLFRFVDALEALTAEFEGRRRKLMEVTLDGDVVGTGAKSLHSLVERIIRSIADDVAQIAERSLSRDEFVLRVQVGRHRREERFLSVSNLARKVVSLPVSFHDLFAPIIFPLQNRRRADSGSGRPSSIAGGGRVVKLGPTRRARLDDGHDVHSAWEETTEIDGPLEPAADEVDSVDGDDLGQALEELSPVSGEIERASVVLPLVQTRVS